MTTATNCRTVPYWWTGEICELRQRSNMLRRAMDRANTRNRTEEDIIRLKADYKDARKMLMKKIRESKRNGWNELLKHLDEDIWGDAYRIATKEFKSSGTPYKMSKDRERQVIDCLFPDMPCFFNRTRETTVDEADLFTVAEVITASDKLKKNKAPGPDGIPAEIVKLVATKTPHFLTGILNRLLSRQLFPYDWKTGKLALIPKPGKPRDSPNAYRPICLINVVAKLYEHLVKERLETALEELGGPDLLWGLLKAYSGVLKWQGARYLRRNGVL